MAWMLALLAAIPVGAVSWIWRIRKPNTSRWLRTYLPCLAALTAIGAAAGTPFITTRVVGTGESYNYTLALADALAQVRGGHIPPLVGETEYAFNGRVHPLRTAPYLFYFGAALDALTLHRLTAWQVQNLSLALSLMATAFAAYFGLRRATDCSRPATVLLVSTLLLSPALLAVTYVLNMFMTVHAGPFVVGALSGCLRQARRPDWRNDAIIGASLGTVWLCHPPIALWTSGCVFLVRGFTALRQGPLRSFPSIVASGAIALCVSAFVFASVKSLSGTTDLVSIGATSRTAFVRSVITLAREAWVKWITPVGLTTLDTLGSIQLSYVHWLYLAASIGGWIFLRARCLRRDEGAALAGLILGVLFLLLATFPVSVVTYWIWAHLPDTVLSLTNIWPVQRTLPIATALLVFSAAMVWPVFKFSRRQGWIVAAIVLGWTVYQAAPYIRTGLEMRRVHANGDDDFESSNIDLTVTSYAYLGVPETFIYGTIDPELELQLVDRESRVVRSNYEAALSSSTEVGQGTLSLPGGSSSSTPRPRVHLEPGEKYLLLFDFKSAPISGHLQINGPKFHRNYFLPEAGMPRGFGMLERNRRAICIWTSAHEAEDVDIWVETNNTPAAVPGSLLATYTLREIDRTKLPVQLVTLSPLTLRVEAPTPQCYVETFRRFSPGYSAKVNGRRTTAETSRASNVMVPVPRGVSTVSISNRPSTLLYSAFIASLVSCGICYTWSFLELFNISVLPRAVGWIRRAGRWLSGSRAAASLRTFFVGYAVVILSAGAAALVLVGISYPTYTYKRAIGPLHIRFLLPLDQVGSRQALVSAGRPGAGTIVFITYPDPDHVTIGFDVWGSLYESAPISIDRGGIQDLVLDFAALYPLEHPRISSLTAFQKQRIRGTLRAELNGATVISQSRVAFDSAIQDVYVGGSKIGGSLADPQFHGTIVQSERLPFQTPFTLTTTNEIKVVVDPETIDIGARHPLFSLSPNGGGGVGYVVRTKENAAQFGFCASDGTSIESGSIRVKSPLQIECVFGKSGNGGPIVASLKANGKLLIAPSPFAPLQQPVTVFPGVNPTGLGDVASRFLGTSLSVVPATRDATEASRARGVGAVELYVTFPAVRPAQPEPLVVTGRTGAGDFVFVRYVDAQHVSFGMDHWGVGGAAGSPVPIDFSVPHRVAVALGSLYPSEEGAQWKGTPRDLRDQALRTVTVHLDGKEVFTAPLTPHPASRDQVYLGENPLGGSSCTPSFSGEIHGVSREGLPKR